MEIPRMDQFPVCDPIREANILIFAPPRVIETFRCSSR